MILDKNANKQYKMQKLAKQARFEILQKKLSNMPRVGWAEESKNGLGFKIGPRQQKCQRTPNL